MELYEKYLLAIIVVFIIGGISLVGLRIYSNTQFCNNYFNEVPTWECVISSRYKYDHLERCN